jgi:pyruvate kinase
MKRRTRIVCTIGPATAAPARIRGLIRAGMNVARLNFSHGTHAEHRRQAAIIRDAAADLGANIALLMDLQGPKIRTGPLKNGEAVQLEKDAPLILTTRPIAGDAAVISTGYEKLPADLNSGDRILIADGTLELRVEHVEGEDVHCRVVRGGMLGEHKGINLPGVRIAEPSLTGKDRADLAFGLNLGVDYIALSFVRSPDDIRKIRSLVADREPRPGIVAKIERPEALDDFEEIVKLCDAVMVARGDLGVEIPFEEVPVVQKRLIRTCNQYGVPVITATQMLESMTEQNRPTRAEVADVANAILDGTDAVMLSGETAVGAYPERTCEVMASIAERQDREMARIWEEKQRYWLHAGDVKRRTRITGAGEEPYNVFADAIGMAASSMAEMMDIRMIVCFTTSGYSASAIARYRPDTPILALTPEPATRRKCSLIWGVEALLTEEIDDADRLPDIVEPVLIENGLAENGDTILIVAGIPLAVGGITNSLRLHTLGSDAA